MPRDTFPVVDEVERLARLRTTGYRASPEEIGRIRREIRECVRMERETGTVLMNVIMKAATLDEPSWIWLRQRMRPAELSLLDRWTSRP